jgi:hypothetical protein
MEGETTGGEDGAVVFASDGEGGGAADVGVSFHDAEIDEAGDGFNDGGGEGFCTDTVKGAFVQGGEAEDVPGAGNAEEEEAPFAGGGGDFDAAFAEDVEVIGG